MHIYTLLSSSHSQPDVLFHLRLPRQAYLLVQLLVFLNQQILYTRKDNLNNATFKPSPTKPTFCLSRSLNVRMLSTVFLSCSLFTKTKQLNQSCDPLQRLFIHVCCRRSSMSFWISLSWSIRFLWLMFIFSDSFLNLLSADMASSGSNNFVSTNLSSSSFWYSLSAHKNWLK